MEIFVWIVGGVFLLLVLAAVADAVFFPNRSPDWEIDFDGGNPQ